MIAHSRPKHFFGAIVGNPESSWTWVVIDGQQRLTTVSLLMLALSHSIETGTLEVEEYPGLGKRIMDDYLYAGDEKEAKFKLKPVKDDDLAYRRLFGDPKDFIESSNVTANYHYFLKRLTNISLTAEELWDAICRLEVMLLDLESHDDPQRIFESLNSTGLALKEADKIRNLVLMGLPHKQQTRLYEERWNPIEQNVDFRTDWFIRWYLVSKTSKTPKENDVFEAFKTFTASSSLPVEKILDDMFDHSQFCRDLTTASTGMSAADKRLRRVNLILGDVVLPFLMPVLRDTLHGLTDEDDFLQVIKILESYTFRRLASSVAANALNKIFASAYNELHKLRTNNQPYAELLTYILRRRDGGSGRFLDDNEFREHFETRNFYSIRGNIKQYLFECLENGESNDTRDILKGVRDGDLTIEHVMPQTLTQSWREMLGPEAENVHATWCNRIANLTVTGYNSTYSNSSFDKKKAMEHGFLSSPYRLNNFIKLQKQWRADELAERSRLLANFALNYWRFPETDFCPPSTVLPSETMGTDSSFKGRVVVAYEFGEVKESVQSWTDLLAKVMLILVQQYRSEIMLFAQSEPMLHTSEQGNHDANPKLRKVDPSLWVWVHSNTDAKITLLRKVFDHLEIDPEEMIFILRPDKDVPEESTNVVVESTYSSLIKYLPQLDEAASTNSELNDTDSLRTEFLQDFEQFKRVDPIADLGGKTIEQFKADTNMENASEEQILALITVNLQMADIMGPTVLHTAITSGEFSRYLDRLEKVG